MQIRTSLTLSEQDNSSIKVLIIGNHFIPVNETAEFQKQKPVKFEPKFDPVFNHVHNNKYNVRIIYNLNSQHRQQLFGKLNWWQKQKLLWMLDTHHFQKHWKSYMSWFIVPVITFLISKWTGLLERILNCL